MEHPKMLRQPEDDAEEIPMNLSKPKRKARPKKKNEEEEINPGAKAESTEVRCIPDTNKEKWQSETREAQGAQAEGGWKN